MRLEQGPRAVLIVGLLSYATGGCSANGKEQAAGAEQVEAPGLETRTDVGNETAVASDGTPDVADTSNLGEQSAAPMTGAGEPAPQPSPTTEATAPMPTGTPSPDLGETMTPDEVPAPGDATGNEQAAPAPEGSEQAMGAETPDDSQDTEPGAAPSDPITENGPPADDGNDGDQDPVAGGEEFTGTCTASEATGTNASGSGPHDVVVEVNSAPGINEGTIFRPVDLGGDEKYPILVWGQGACSQDGLANATAMAEIASHGYFVIADGTPNGSGSRPMDRSDMDAMGAPLIAYVDWAIAENDKPCSAYYQSLDVAMVSSNGFSCGGLMAQGTITDPRIVTWGVTSSGMAGATQAFYDSVRTPVLFVEGGPAEVAYDGGLAGYEAISQLGVPVLWFSKDIGHGGDLFQPDGGDFTRINLAWLNWWLKGDESATGKGLLVGDDCPYCSDSEWEVMSANLP